MRLWKPLAVGIGAILLTTATLVPVWRSTRGVRLVDEPSPAVSHGFDPRQSAALFIGVRKFPGDQTPEVPYAADDAVDLAHAFALDPRVRLVSAERVVIALSGRPQKPESQARLEELVDAGAKVGDAGQSDILTLLQRQAATAGKDGIVIVSLATHGFVKEGVPYVLGSTSLFQYPETALPTPKLFEIAATSEAGRSLFFIDACRERITADARAGASPATAAPFIGRMGRVNGQVVFFAAAAGGYAYDDDGNGVFTKAILEALKCKATLVRGAVTVGTLRTFVERFVRTWIRQHRNLRIGAATQVSMDGDSHTMPLCKCNGELLPPPAGNPVRATYQDSTVSGFSAIGTRLWSRNVNGAISRVQVADLDADGSREVVVGANTIDVFDRAGRSMWSANERMRLHTFLVDDLLRHDSGLQIIGLWEDESASRSRVSMYSAKGQRLSAYDHAGRLQQIAIDRPTSHHGRRIIITGTDAGAGSQFGIHRPMAGVMVLDTTCRPVWAGLLFPPTERIARFEVADHDNDARRDIAVSTVTGNTLYLDFDGKALERSSRLVTLKILPRNARRK